MRFSTLRNATAALACGALAVAVMAGPASGATAKQARAAARASHRLPLSAAQVAADQRRDLASLNRTSTVTGIVRTAAGNPLPDVCVTARAGGPIRTAVSRQDGRFLLPGLRRGSYQLTYRDCGSPGSASALLHAPLTRHVIVTGQPVQPLAPISLPTARPQNRRPQGRDLRIRPASPLALARKLLGFAAQPNVRQRAAAAESADGVVSGRVTSKDGHGIKGICAIVFLVATQTSSLAKTRKDGSYRVRAPVGSSEVVFLPGCGNTGNWVGQFYRNAYNPAKLRLIQVKAGRTVSGIDGVLSLGGQISGTVTGTSGHGLTDVCVNPVAVGKGFQYLFAASVISDRGSYLLNDLPSGRYRVEFVPCDDSIAQYAPVLWHSQQTLSTAGVVRVRAGGAVSGIDQMLPIGGTISGTVTDSSGNPLAGICVMAASAEPWRDYIFTQTAADGSYQIIGAPTSTYQLYFNPCVVGDNYLEAISPDNIKATDGVATTGVNIALQAGGIVSGTVTSSTGQPLKHICVLIAGGSFDIYGGLTRTNASGRYSMDVLETATYTVQFSGGCGNSGSYAPQAWRSINPATPTPVKIRAGQQATAIDAVMQPGGTISGTVTRSSGKKLTGICVVAGPTIAMQQSQGAAFAGAAATTGGGYRIANLMPGNYAVEFGGNCGNTADLADQWYMAQPGEAGASSVWAGPGVPATDINASLRPGGGFSGHFLTAAGHVVIGTCLQVTDLASRVQSPYYTFFSYGESFSGYQLDDLQPGPYQVVFNSGCADTPYATQWYNDRQSQQRATTVMIRPGHIVRHVSSALVPGGIITGRVTSAATGRGVGNVCVYAQSTSQPLFFGTGQTNARGYYAVHALNTSGYELLFAPCYAGGDGNLAGALLTRVVPATTGERTEGADIALAAGGTIAGAVTAGSPAAAQQDICVQATGVSNKLETTTTTGAHGRYRLLNVPPGSYNVLFAEPGCGIPDLLADQAYASRVTVTAGAVTSGISADLVADGTISGRVTATRGSGLTGICVAAIGTIPGSTPVVESSKSGAYTIGGLLPGSYLVRFSAGCGTAGYHTQWWDGASSRGTAKIIDVTPGAAITGIDASMHS